MEKRINYRKLAFQQYDPVCAHCGFGITAVLEVAHIDCDRCNNELSNLVILCPNCHKMHDLDLISTDMIIQMRDRPKVVRWSKRMKDAGKKAAMKRLRRAAARKAVVTRRQRSLEVNSQNGEVAVSIPLTEPQRKDLRRRLKSLKANPNQGAPWEEVKARLEQSDRAEGDRS